MVRTKEPSPEGRFWRYKPSAICFPKNIINNHIHI